MQHYNQYLKTLGRLAKSTARAVKSLVPHKPEHGRLVEEATKSLLIRVLPRRFSLGTGQIVTAKGMISGQTDIVVYDHELNSPLLLGEGAGLFPIECVYAAIEVKATLDRKALTLAMKAIRKIRDMKVDKYYEEYLIETKGAKALVRDQPIRSTLAPRTFIVAYRPYLKHFPDFASLLRAVEKGCVKHGAHIHGLVVIEKNWFIRQRPNRNPPEFKKYRKNGLQQFCISLRMSLNSFRMKPAAMERYLHSEDNDV